MVNDKGKNRLPYISPGPQKSVSHLQRPAPVNLRHWMVLTFCGRSDKFPPNFCTAASLSTLVHCLHLAGGEGIAGGDTKYLKISKNVYVVPEDIDGQRNHFLTKTPNKHVPIFWCRRFHLKIILDGGQIPPQKNIGRFHLKKWEGWQIPPQNKDFRANTTKQIEITAGSQKYTK